MTDISAGAVAAGVDAMPVETAILDADGTILVVNDAWRRFADENHGAHPDYWVGENYFDICEGTDTDPRAVDLVADLEAVLAGEREVLRVEYPCHSPSEQRWYTVEAAGFSHEGDRYLFVCHFDVTGRKLAELRANARTEQLESLLGVLTHDIRNPLQVIEAHAELLAQELDGIEEAATDDGSAVNHRIESIMSAVARISEITEATLEFTRTGALSTVEAVSVGVLAREAWEYVETGDATLVVRDSRTVHGDRRLLCQLFENLFRNAVEHAGPDCTVTVEALGDGFAVEDDGPGIPESVREKTLRADYSTRGTGGLGLPIVQAVVRAHGGQLRITDADAGGARFELTGFDVAPDGSSGTAVDAR